MKERTKQKKNLMIKMNKGEKITGIGTEVKYERGKGIANNLNKIFIHY